MYRDPNDPRFKINPPQTSPVGFQEAIISLRGKEYLTMVGLLQQILVVLGGGPSNYTPGFFIAAISGASTTTRLIATHFVVRAAIIENISTNSVTLGSSTPLTVGTGFILNGASASGNAGDALTVGNTDLFEIFFNQTGTGNTLAVYYEA